MDRPETITKQELQNPPAEQSGGMQRGQAFAHDGIWAGFAAFLGGASTGWHHHADYDTWVAAKEEKASSSESAESVPPSSTRGMEPGDMTAAVGLVQGPDCARDDLSELDRG